MSSWCSGIRRQSECLLTRCGPMSQSTTVALPSTSLKFSAQITSLIHSHFTFQAALREETALNGPLESSFSGLLRATWRAKLAGGLSTRWETKATACLATDLFNSIRAVTLTCSLAERTHRTLTRAQICQTSCTPLHPMEASRTDRNLDKSRRTGKKAKPRFPVASIAERDRLLKSPRRSEQEQRLRTHSTKATDLTSTLKSLS